MERRDVNRVFRDIAKQAERAMKQQIAKEKAREKETIRYAEEVAKREAIDKAKQKGSEFIYSGDYCPA